MNVDEYLLRETLRQSGTVQELIGMQWALSGVKLYENHYSDAKHVLGYAIASIKGIENYRVTPVIFRDGSEGLKPELISNAMNRVFSRINDIELNDRNEIDTVCHSILIIHPFLDGNGRSVSVLRNWMLNQLDDPEILPYYFGEEL